MGQGTPSGTSSDNSPAFYGTLRQHLSTGPCTEPHESSPTVSIVCLRFRDPIPSVFQTKIVSQFLMSSMRATRTDHLVLPFLITHITFDEEQILHSRLTLN
jgi:hypothetical protein